VQIVADVLARDVGSSRRPSRGPRRRALGRADPGSGRSLEAVPGRLDATRPDLQSRRWTPHIDALFDVYLATVEAQTPTWELPRSHDLVPGRPQPALE